jgi:adenosylcobyric acid synthase
MAALMIQGCGSDVGKSMLVAGLCRLFTNHGLTVRPFKSQNMSNNAAVTADGGEIGRAQALQALACRTPASVHMNPVLLKPQSETGAQLIVRGQMHGSWSAANYQQRKALLLDICLESFHTLEAECDLVIVEGAGSPAETNLRKGDIANMGFARAANVPVILTGDIDRGHVIAALVGAHTVLEEGDRAMIKGFLINKFRGDPALFATGREEITRRTGWRDYGMAPFLPAARRLPAEDAVALDKPQPGLGGRVKIVVPRLSRIANFDDFDPLQHEPAVDFRFIQPGTALPGDADLIILPGSKSTIADLAMFRAEGWDIDLAAHIRRGGRVLGLCGGYQMLGRRVIDPDGIEGPPGEAPGLGLLDIETTLTGEKVLTPTQGHLIAENAAFEGYEIHVGRTTGPDTQRPFLHTAAGPQGAISANGRIAGCYIHGLFQQGSARAAILKPLGATSNAADHSTIVDAALDEIAAALAKSFDIPGLAALAGLPASFSRSFTS